MRYRLCGRSDETIRDEASVNPAESWDTRLREHGGHLLQSWDWGEFKRQRGWRPERIHVETDTGVAMAQILFRHKGPFGIGYIPRGPVVDGDRVELWPRLRREIDAAARRHRAISVILEPNCPPGMVVAAQSHDVMTGPCHIQPARTVKVPLLDDDPLLAQMHHKTRYNIRLAPRRGVQFGPLEPTPTNIAAFHQLLRETATRNGFATWPASYYAGVLETLGERAALLGAWTAEGDLAAALVVETFGDEAIYLYGASSTEHRAHGAAIALQFDAMRWARERGCTCYDLWGIPVHDPDSTTTDTGDHISRSHGKDWRGLFRFKTGFGGEIVSYPPTVERRYLPLLPWLARRLGIITG